MRHLIIAAALLAASPAIAQSQEDCTGRPFVMRPYQRGTVIAGVRMSVPDPANARFGRMHGLCKPGSPATIVCGEVARMNAVGFVEDATTFFGAYAKNRFYVISAGDDAVAACQKYLYAVPAF